MAEVTKAKQETSDTWVTTKVKADILTEKGLPGGDIDIQTQNGVVTLSSPVPVTEAQKHIAVAIAKRIKGVRDVSATGLKAE